MKQIPAVAIIALLVIGTIVFVCVFFTAIHSGQSGDPEWENYTETFFSMAEAEAVLGEKLELTKLLAPTGELDDGWRRYIEKEYGADMLAKQEKEWTIPEPFEEVILYHKTGGGVEQPESWEWLEARIRYDGKRYGDIEDEIHYPNISFMLYFEQPNDNAFVDRGVYNYIHKDGEEVAYQEYIDHRGHYGFYALFEWNGRKCILTTESPNDNWFGMKTLKRLLEWDIIYIPDGAYFD